MDIGTAKPTPAERAEIRHHGIDLADPCAGLHRRALPRAPTTPPRPRSPPAAGVAAARRRHRAVPAGRHRRPRAAGRVAGRPGRAGGRTRHRRAPRPPPARSIRPPPPRWSPRNRRRIVRALEVCLGSGRPFSTFGPGLDSLPADAGRPDRPALAPGPAHPAHRGPLRARCSPPASSTRSGPWPRDPGGLSRTAAPGHRLRRAARRRRRARAARRGHRARRGPHPALRRPPGTVVPARSPGSLDRHRRRPARRRAHRPRSLRACV